MLIISFDWQEKMGDCRGQTCEDILFPAKVLYEDLVKRKIFFGTLHLRRYYAVVTSINRKFKLSLKLTDANVFYSC